MLFWNPETLHAVLLVLALQLLTFLVTLVRRNRERDTNQLGLKILPRKEPILDHDVSDLAQEQCDAEFDVIAVHGLGASPEYTWSARAKHRDGRQIRVNWLIHGDFLYGTFPNARIMAFNHNADWFYDAPTAPAEHRAEELLKEIKIYQTQRRGQNQKHNPIVLIGHSYGGNIVKEVIRKGNDNLDEYAEVLQAITGIIFLGTPHLGSTISALFATIAKWSAPLLGSSDLILKSLIVDEYHLETAHNSFRAICRQGTTQETDLWKTSHCFWETLDTKVGGIINIGKIVGVTSARAGGQFGEGFNKNHTGMNKFSSPRDQDFQRICRAIKACAEGPRAARCRAFQNNRVLSSKMNSKWNLDVVEAAKALLIDETSFIPSTGNLSDGACGQFLVSDQYQDWSRLRTLLNPEYHAEKGFLWFLTTPDVRTSEAMQKVFQDLENPSIEGSVDIAIFAPTASTFTDSLDIKKLMQTLIAQLVSRKTPRENRVPSRRLKSLSRERTESVLKVLKDELGLDPQKYWNIMADLVQANDDPVAVVIDRVDCIQHHIRDYFLGELVGFWNMLKRRCCLKILVSGRPFDDLERRLHPANRFDASQDLLGKTTSFRGLLLYISDLTLDMLESLERLTKNPRHGDITNGIPNTGDWFLKDLRFTEFLAGSYSQIFWIHGLPGSGKSTLLKTVLGHIEKRFNNSNSSGLITGRNDDFERIRAVNQGRPQQNGERRTIVASFFYRHHDTGQKAEMSHKVMLLSVLFQILQQERRLLRLYSAHRGNNFSAKPWSPVVMEPIFRDICNWQDFPITIYLCVDALNESESDSVEINRQTVLEFFAGIAKKKSTGVIWKIIVTTRDLAVPISGFKKRHSIRLHEENKDDLQKVIENGIRSIEDRLNDLRMPPPRPLHEIENDVRKHSGGVILWAQLVLEMLKQSLITKSSIYFQDLPKHLFDLPAELKELENLYIKMTKLLKEKSNVQESKEWLQLGTIAWRSLKSAEFIDAQTLCPSNPRRVESIHEMKGSRLVVKGSNQGMRNALAIYGGGFLELKIPQHSSTSSLQFRLRDFKKRKDGVIQLAHETVRSFLRTDKASPFQLNQTDGHKLLATICTRYLELALGFRQCGIAENLTTSVVLGHLEDLPLLSYVFQNLPVHLSDLESLGAGIEEHNDLQTTISNLYNEPMESKSILSVWTRTCERKARNSTFWAQCVRLISDQGRSFDQTANTYIEKWVLDAVKTKTPVALHVLLATGALKTTGCNSSQYQKDLMQYATVGKYSDRILGVLEEFDLKRLGVQSPLEEFDTLTSSPEESVVLHDPSRSNSTVYLSETEGTLSRVTSAEDSEDATYTRKQSRNPPAHSYQITFGSNNMGIQVGQNFGPISMKFGKPARVNSGTFIFDK